MLATIALMTWIFGGDTLFTGDPLLAVLSGGAILGAFFMATDYVTSPSNKMSQIIFGTAIGAITVLIRLKGGYPEGVCYAILLMNPLSTVLDGWFKRKRFSPEPVKDDKSAKPEAKSEKSEQKPDSKEEKSVVKSEKSEQKPDSKEEKSVVKSEKSESDNASNAAASKEEKHE